MSGREFSGRSGRVWVTRRVLLRPGHLRPQPHDNAEYGPHAVDMVKDAEQDVHGALRRFASRAERGRALALLGSGSPALPALLDVVDDPRLPPALVTAWVPGASEHFLDRLTEADDLGALLRQGRRWRPAQAIRDLVPLGSLLDTVAESGFVPVELSPDHVIYNRGSIRLVGISRHLYRPGDGPLPPANGMSLATTLLLGADYPGQLANHAVWRQAQQRALLRLAGWMVCGLAPAAWGPTGSERDLHGYLSYAGFAGLPMLQPGRLAESLSAAADEEERREIERRISGAAAFVFYDDLANGESKETPHEWVSSFQGQSVQATVAEVRPGGLTVHAVISGNDVWKISVKRSDTSEGRHGRVDLTEHYQTGDYVTVRITGVEAPRAGAFWPQTSGEIAGGVGQQARPRLQVRPLDINPESVRLGLLLENGPDVVAIAAFPAKRRGTNATALSGAGWVLVEPADLPAVAARMVEVNPGARYLVAGRASAPLGAVLRPVGSEAVDPDVVDPPLIDGRPATDLPYLRDPKLDEFFTEMLRGQGGNSLRRRTFAAGWALAYDEPARRRALRQAEKDDGKGLRKSLGDLTELFGTNTELLIQVRTFLSRPGLRKDSTARTFAGLRRAAPVLSGLPTGGRLRRDLIAALLSSTYEDLDTIAAERLLPVSIALARIYDPAMPLAGRSLAENLYDRAGLQRLGLFGRVVIALPDHDEAGLADAVSALDDRLVTVLADIPAPSLQHLVGLLRSPDLYDALRPHISGPDLELLNWYTPAAWEILLADLRQPAHIGPLGLGWALIAERDPHGTVDARALLDLAAATGREPREVVRNLLDTPVESWPLVLAHPILAARWLERFGTLDIGAVVQAYPDAEDLAEWIDVGGLRNAYAAGLGRDELRRLCDFAAAVDMPVLDLLNSYLGSGRGIDELDLLTTAAAAGWVRHRLDAGRSVAEALQEMTENPGLLRTWAVNGARLPMRLLKDVLNADPESLGVTGTEGRALTTLLAEQPGLIAVTARAMFPRQRLRLLRLAASRPDRKLACTVVRESVTDLVDQPDAEAYLDVMLTEGLTFAQAQLARRQGLDRTGRTLLRTLGPSAQEIPANVLPVLLEIVARYGTGCAMTVAMVEQSEPGTAALVAAWGPVWIPLLAGSDRRRVRTVLARERPPGPDTAWLSRWLIAAGVDGLVALERHGGRLLQAVQVLRAPAADVRVIATMLEHRWPPEALYPLVTRHGLPAATWGHVAEWLSEGRDEGDVLLALWDRRYVADAPV
jgi:hypothetical protein